MRQKKQTFQEKLKTLETIQQAIQDNEDGNLEALVELYEKGLTLATELEKEIEKYEKKILDIVSSQENQEEVDEHSSQNDTQHAISHTKVPSQKTSAQKTKDSTGKNITLFDEQSKQ